MNDALLLMILKTAGVSVLCALAFYIVGMCLFSLFFEIAKMLAGSADRSDK